MAQFITQGRLKLFFSGEGVSLGLEPKDPFHSKLRSVQTYMRGLRFLGSTKTRLFFSSSSSSSSSSVNNKSSNFSAEASLNVSDDEGVYDEDDGVGYDDEFKRDDLADFRGLVLDISYRSVFLMTHLLIVFHFITFLFFV
jgi:hypothetical protein